MRQIFPIPHLVLQEYDSHRFLIAIMNLVDQICPYLRFGRIGMQDTNSQSASVIDRILNVLGADSRDGQVTVNFTCIAKYHLIFCEFLWSKLLPDFFECRESVFKQINIRSNVCLSRQFSYILVKQFLRQHQMSPDGRLCDGLLPVEPCLVTLLESIYQPPVLTEQYWRNLLAKSHGLLICRTVRFTSKYIHAFASRVEERPFGIEPRSLPFKKFANACFLGHLAPSLINH